MSYETSSTIIGQMNAIDALAKERGVSTKVMLSDILERCIHETKILKKQKKWADKYNEVRIYFQLFLAGVASLYVVFIAISIIVEIVRHSVYGCALDLPIKDLFLVVGGLLAVSAATELAYMLLTEGPDEAVDPLLISIAAAALVSLGKAKTEKVYDQITDLYPYVIIMVSVVCIAILFFVRQRFLR